ncbi:MAG: hypothetical protein U0531_15385 [Dehalococcoidia bacterium]
MGERLPDDAAVCSLCGGAVPVMQALVYHGVVYHPACAPPRGQDGARDLSSRADTRSAYDERAD